MWLINQWVSSQNSSARLRVGVLYVANRTLTNNLCCEAITPASFGRMQQWLLVHQSPRLVIFNALNALNPLFPLSPCVPTTTTPQPILTPPQAAPRLPPHAQPSTTFAVSKMSGAHVYCSTTHFPTPSTANGSPRGHRCGASSHCSSSVAASLLLLLPLSSVCSLSFLLPSWLHLSCSPFLFHMLLTLTVTVVNTTTTPTKSTRPTLQTSLCAQATFTTVLGLLAAHLVAALLHATTVWDVTLPTAPVDCVTAAARLHLLCSLVVGILFKLVLWVFATSFNQPSLCAP